MTTIKIALTNLGKYNEGELVYKWITLPVTFEELMDAEKEIGIGSENEHGDVYEEAFITDYEAPGGLQIGEYADIGSLNKLAEQLEQIDIPEPGSFGMWDAAEVVNFAMNLCNDGIVSNADEYVQDIVDDDHLDEMVRGIIESDGGWRRVTFFLQDADRTADFHLIDGYGNVARLTNDTLESIVTDLIHEIQANI
jgi:hypothetical protein